MDNLEKFQYFGSTKQTTFAVLTICCRPEFHNCMTWSCNLTKLTHSLTQLNAKLVNIVGAGADVGVEDSIVDYKLVTADSLAAA